MYQINNSLIKRRGEMKRGQISFEYIILFSIVLLLFIALGTITAAGLSKSRTVEKDAQMLADQIKVQVITASLSRVDYTSELTLPESIQKNYYQVEISATDDMVIIRDENNGVIGKAFLPLIDEAPGVMLGSRDTIVFMKDENRLTVEKK
jgi:hypothetical protein